MLTTLVQNNISFTSMPLQKVNLRKVSDGKPFEAVLSKLDPFDINDQISIDNISRDWITSNEGSNTNQILLAFCEGFKDRTAKNDCYTIELPGPESLDKRLIGMMSLRGYQLLNVKSKPKSLRTDQEKNLKMVGAVLLGKALDVIRNRGFKEASFTSLQNSFYVNLFREAGMTEGKNNDYACEVLKGIRIIGGTKFNVFRRGMKKLLEHLRINESIEFNPEVK